MAKKFNYDASGWATKSGVRCYDGLVIQDNAFKGCNGKIVPIVWNHDHSRVDSVLGHALLENKKGGVYAYLKFNGTEQGQYAKECVQCGDLNGMSIFANQIKKMGDKVMHGMIQEVSLVIAGCNPGALIQEVVSHSLDGKMEMREMETDLEDGHAMIWSDEMSIVHGTDPDGMELDDRITELWNEDGTALSHADKEEEMSEEMTQEASIKDVYEQMTEEQKKVVHALVGAALNSKNEDMEEEDENVKHNVFDRDDTSVMKYSMDELNRAVADGKKEGSLKEAFIAHGIDNLEYLYPEDHVLDTPPQIVDANQDWVSVVMNSIHHIPFSRFKSLFADMTEEDARAKGYIKGSFKKEQVFSLLKRSTSATTIYKKQKMDRDDMIEITSFDVAAFLKKEMRAKLNEEIAAAVLVGDGRPTSSDDKINEQCIRPIAKDDDFFTIKVKVETSGMNTREEKIKAVIKAVIKSRKDYKGSGNPTFFTTDDVLSDMLLLEDQIGHCLYKDEQELARKLRVKNIVTVPRMEGVKGAGGGELVGLVVNLADYTAGADKGGAVSFFDGFDIDYNAQKYLIETRMSGALVKPFSAIAVELSA